MNRKDMVLTIKSMSDIDVLKEKNIKYINIDIKKVNSDIINYLINNGKDYLYSESINNKDGYIYVDYYTFVKGEEVIKEITSNIPRNLNDIELAKYLYIMIGKNIGYDISILNNNDTFDLSKIGIVNNIWGALKEGYANNVSYTKIYLYLCSLYNIKSDIVSVNDKNYLCNKLVIDKNTLIVDLTKDVKYIESLFKTRYFSNYNDDIKLDKKIGYIKDNYNEVLIDNNIKISDEGEYIYKFLLDTMELLPIKNIKSIELGLIYKELFNKYYPDDDVEINNLYVNSINKKYFVLISYDNNYYSYNYNKSTFIKLNKNYLVENFNEKKLGVCDNTSLMNNLEEVI